MELLLLLLSAHFIADFYLQPPQWQDLSNSKPTKAKLLWRHIIINVLLYSTVFFIIKFAFLSSIIAIGALTISQFLLTYFKSKVANTLSYFLLVQSLQIIAIGIVWTWLSDITMLQIFTYIEDLLSAKNIIIAMSYLLVCKPASVIIALALKKHTDSLLQVLASRQKQNEPPEEIGLLSAGAWIGYIERCLAISFIFMGQFAGIGFLVATKTIFRFGDLTKNQDMKLTEYMMLGTLLSYAIALLVGWNAMQWYQVM